jgi:peroxiredoxin
MPALESPDVQFGWHAIPFSLVGLDGKRHTLDSVRGPNGLLIMFLSETCPYVQKQWARILDDCRHLRYDGIHALAIFSHAAQSDISALQVWATQAAGIFPCVHDASQQLARAYEAVSTPDFLGFNTELHLQYRGRLDESWSGIIEKPNRELRHAMRQIATTGVGPEVQQPAVGSAIAWQGAPRMVG